MSVIPDQENLQLELAALGSSLYDCIDKGERLGPTMKEYNRCRSEEWCTSESLLSVYNLPVSRAGWVALLSRYGFQHPSPSDVQKAAHQRKEERRDRRPHIVELDESYPELVSSSHIDVVTQDGTTITYWTIR